MSKNLIHPSAVKKSHSLSPVLQILCFCDGEQLYLLVGITRLPQEPSSEHLFLSSWENKAESSGEHSVMTDQMFWAQATVKGNRDCCASLCTQKCFPLLHVQTHPWSH